jgi:NTE family protein
MAVGQLTEDQNGHSRNMAEPNMSNDTINEAVDEFRRNKNGQVVLVLQGGGALGAFQVGVYQAFHECGIEPDWIIGTSIGAINAGLIAGNRPVDRISKLNEFWKRVERPAAAPCLPAWSGLADAWSNWVTLAGGIPGFFRPDPLALWNMRIPGDESRAAFYSTASLRETITELCDFSILERGKLRLTVGAANVRTSMMRYFDSRDSHITADQIMASGALPPAFPAICIDNEHYWDGGILSNTPTEVVFDDYPRRNSLVFAVHLWNPIGATPRSIWEVLHRQKDVQYSSRIASHISRQQQTHRLRHVISQLAKEIPVERRDSEAVRELTGYGCVTQMHIVRLLAPRVENESHAKDIDFSASGIKARREAGYASALQVLRQAPWRGEFDPIEGVLLHEPTELPLAAE